MRSSKKQNGKSAASPKSSNGGPLIAAPAIWSLEDSDPGTPLTAADRAMLAAIATIVRFRKGEIIHQEGDAAVSVYNIINGVAESYQSQPDQPRHIVGFFFPGDIVGLAEAGKYVNALKAVTALTMYKMPATALEARLKRHAGLDFHIISKLCHDLRQTQHHAFLLSKHRADAKMGLFLQMLETQQRSQGGAADEVYLPMSRIDIGSYAGISPEAVTRALRKLAGTGAIRMQDRRHIKIVNRARLEEIVSGAEVIDEILP